MRPENIDGLIVTDMVGPVRWGIAGTGTISQQMTKDFRLVGGRQVVAVASRNQSSADAFGDEFDIPHRFDDYARMLESVDAVYIGTPHVTHFDLAHQALERGRSVLCEKPIGLNGVEVRLLAKTARQNGVFFDGGDVDEVQSAAPAPARDG